MNSSVRHLVFGLRLDCNEPLPGVPRLARGDGPADVVVRLGAAARDRIPPFRAGSRVLVEHASTAGGGGPAIRISQPPGGGGVLFEYEEGFRFFVPDDARSIWGDWSAPYAAEDAGFFVLGPLLGYVLRLRGVTCLHASGVVVGRLAIALVGPSGVGKSTAAFAFARAGHAILSDDLLPLAPGDPRPFAVPAYPRLRLWPDVVRHFEGDEDARPRLSPQWDKRYVPLADGGRRFVAEPVPLAAVYLLDRRPGAEAPSLLPVRPVEAVPFLAAQTYRADLLTPALRTIEFDFLADLVRRVRVRRCAFGSGLEDLDALCGALLDDAGRAA